MNDFVINRTTENEFDLHIRNVYAGRFETRRAAEAAGRAMARIPESMLMKDDSGHEFLVQRHRSIRSAKLVYSAAQRRVYGIRVFELPGGGFDSFPKGHPVPAGATLAE